MKRILALLTALCLWMAMVPAAQGEEAQGSSAFTDVAEWDWFASGVALCCDRQIMVGVGDGRFLPDAVLTAPECLTLALRLYGEGREELLRAPADWGGEYGGAWWRDSLYTAQQWGFTGRSDCPGMAALCADTPEEKPVTRLTFARALAEVAGTLEPVTSVYDLPDLPWSSENAGVYALYEAGVLTGVDASGSFAPADTLTRAQAATMLARVLDPALRVQDEVDLPLNDASVALIGGAGGGGGVSTAMNFAPMYHTWEIPGVTYNTEEYGHTSENPFHAVQTTPLSTFAADVDTASYANVRRMLLAGEDVPADAVRVEEFINYFHYDYAQPRGEDPFGVSTQMTACPWNPDAMLLRIGLQAREPEWDVLPRSNLVFLIDVSGSMYDADKLPLVKRAFSMLCENLRDEDVISVVTYADGDAVILDGVSGAQSLTIQRAIEELRAGGSTNGSQGIQRAYELAQKHLIPGGNNRVILATDGDLNVGITSQGELIKLIEAKKDSGVFLSVMGFGRGNLKDNKMEALADHGNGNYAYIDSALEARRVLVEEMGGTLFTVAKDVKLQVEFNPATVKGYRLLGYENRLMSAQDFADDAKDGGELGAGHRVTALYEVVGVDSAMDVPGVELKYQSAQPTGSGEWCTVKIRYKTPDGEASRLLEYPVTARPEALDRNTALAACVAQFGMLLQESAYKGTATYQGVLEQLEAIPGIHDDPYTDELCYLVGRMAR